MLPWKRGQRLRLDLVDQPPRLTFRRHVVKPPARHGRVRRELQNPIRQGVPPVVIEKQPAVQPLGAQRGLHFFQSHTRRQFTFVLKFASPAMSRESTTENESTSSSQS